MAEFGTRFSFAGDGKRPVRNVLIFPLPAKPKPALQVLSPVDRVCEDAASELLRVGAVGEDAGQIAHTTRSGACSRIALVSLGDADKLNARKIREAGASAARWLIDQRVQQATLWIDGLIGTSPARPVSEFAGGMVLGGFRFNPHKEPDKRAPARIRVELRSGNPAHLSGKLPRIRDAVAVAESVNYARRLGHEPANVLYPAALANEARRLARAYKLKCTVLTAAELKKQEMNGILAVGRGAEHKPCLIRLDYRGAPKVRPTVVLIGKAVTFDTGGYSLKDKQGLENLKFDKCGGAAVLGILRAVAATGLRCNVIGLVPAAENAISDEAYRPGDIIRMMSGKTVEIISTDAEGRMILADALWYAQQRCKPTAIIDLATLTGGVIIALGKLAAGLMSNNDELAGQLGECGRVTHERLWRLPLWDEYKDLIKGNDSDIRNSSGKRDAHAIVGGLFLKQFVGDDVPWAHIDIAGVATDEAGVAATGFGVRLVTEYLRRLSTRGS